MTNDDKLVYLIDDDDSIRWVLEQALEAAEFEVVSFNTAEQCEQAIAEKQPLVVLSDIRMPGEDGLSFVNRFTKTHADLPIILMTAHCDLETAVKAYEVGAFDYLPKPFDLDEVVNVVNRAIDSKQEGDNEALYSGDKSSGIIGESVAMQTVFKAIGRLSHSEVTVLIGGESGTGKELVASAIHQNSPRRDGQFVAINMAAIPSELIESELFGHEKGAFTGASDRHQGRFEQAAGGTLFLDEIGDMPMAAQTRLLRVLAEGKFFRVGSSRAIDSNVRIVAATHRSLQGLVAKGDFREDLYHRLNVVKIDLPPLRERKQDIKLLTQFFLQSVAREMTVTEKKLKPEVTRILEKHSWPGNVRELENLCRWLTVMTTGTNLGVADLPANFKSGTNKKQDWKDLFESFIEDELISGNNSMIQCQQQFEQILLTTVLKHAQGHRQKTAEILGWGRNTVTRKLKNIPHKIVTK